MSPAEYALLCVGVAAGLCAAAGYGMLAISSARLRVRGCFWAAGIGFGSLGIIWSVWGADPMQSLTVRMSVAAITAAIAAAGLTWALWQIQDHTVVAAAGLSPGGKGGNAKVAGKFSGAEGGTGGKGGIGPGGPGGDAEVTGDHSFARGGDGGNAAQPDGRGGERTLGPAERMNLPTQFWRFGYGGHGADVPEYRRRLALLTKIRTEFMNAFPDDVPYINAGIDPVPLNWVNKRLEEMGESWRVKMGEGGYILPPLK